MPVPDFTNVPLEDLLSLRGRRAVVTGAARGLGLAIAGRLAEAGASVAVGDVNGEGAEAAAQQLARGRAAAAFGARLDVRDTKSVRTFVAWAEAALGGLDIWVNNAGVYPTALAIEMSDEQWDETNDVNLRGTFVCSREAARRMSQIASNTPRVILNIISTSGFRGRSGLSHYTASKHGVVGLTRSLALELGELGIRVLALAPTLTLTPGIRERSAAQHDAVAASVENRIISSIPLGRLGVPDDVARVAVFAVSDLAGFMTGAILCVDGGLTAF
jgi:NAD(P)-dependent dehydrogenase (short-subunit alcohol dehydrogenase family)